MRKSSGFTLIEIIVTLIVIGISAAALMSVFSNLIRGSADPMIQQQAATIAEAYMEEIMLRSFDDPQDPESGAAEGETRATYDDVKDYRALGAGPATDQAGMSIGLDSYIVTLSITNSAFNGVAAVDALRVNVSVNHPAIGDVALTSYRLRNP